jgi:hypothetical protein
MPRITDMGKVGEVAAAALAPPPRDTRAPLPSLGGLTPAEFATRPNQGQSNDGLSL